MAIKTILSICSPDVSVRDIKAVADLCADADAHFSLLMVAIAEPPPTGEYAAELALEWQELRSKDLSDLAEKSAHARQVLEQSGVSFDVQTAYEERSLLDDAVGLRARYCDLVLLSRNALAVEDAVVPLVDGSLFQSARPVLVVPVGCVPTLKPKTILIAWDSRLEAARAVYCAMPFLSAADDVRIVIVDPVASDARNGAEPGADVATYLARHGVNVTVEQLPSGGRPVSDVLKQHATDMAADMLVMGAYGHSRLRERIFGGMTRAFIEGADLPILMAH